MQKEGKYIYNTDLFEGVFAIIYVIIIFISIFAATWVYDGSNKGMTIATALIGPALIMFCSGKIEIDTHKRKFRRAIHWFGIAFGKWNNLPPLDYVSVTNTIYIQPRSRSYAYDEEESATKKLQVKLISTDKEWLVIWEGEDKKEAFAAAKFLAQNLTLKVLNATQSPFVWIE